jgi:hypothetical protein
MIRSTLGKEKLSASREQRRPGGLHQVIAEQDHQASPLGKVPVDSQHEIEVAMDFLDAAEINRIRASTVVRRRAFGRFHEGMQYREGRKRERNGLEAELTPSFFLILLKAGDDRHDVTLEFHQKRGWISRLRHAGVNRLKNGMLFDDVVPQVGIALQEVRPELMERNDR